uniref:aldose 1-epimerase family protein n=1 Tax=Eubacterium sp. TaxID=142586 RepID=UPI004025C846
MIVEIKSENVKVQCLLEGAMLHSLVKDEVEYLWQGDKKYWAGQAPVCFPITGVLRDSKAVAFGKPCEMKRHGVARINPFEIREQGANFVSFIQNSSEETKKAFPFDYSLEIRYTVLKNSVTTRYTVKNTGKDRLPFVIGGHPAFNCPLESGEKFEDYTVEFSGAVNQKCLRPDVETGLVDISKRYDVLDAPNKINLDHSLFDLDAMAFDNIKPKSAVLSAGGRGVKIDYQDFDNLLVWSSSNGGNFVALEPWTGISTCSDEDSVFENKRGMTVLEPDCEASFAFKITLI